MTNRDLISWPRSRAAEGIELVARAARMRLRLPTAASPATGRESGRDAITAAAASLGLDTEPVTALFGEVGGLLKSAGPAVLRLGPDRFVMLIGRSGGRLKVVTPDHRTERVSFDVLQRALLEEATTPLMAEMEHLADESGVRPSSRGRVVRALIAERLSGQPFDAGWLLRPPAGANLGVHLRRARISRALALLVGAHAAQYALWIFAWYLLGRAAVAGHVDIGWLDAWSLAMFTFVPLQLGALWLQGRLAVSLGAVLKQRLLAGSFQLLPEEMRSDGAGQLLGRVIEAEQIASLGLGGGFLAALAGLELMIAMIILVLAAPLLSLLLIAWIAIATSLAVVYLRRRGDWVGLRIALTHDLIERMIGHRTRLAQLPRDQWHDGEDAGLARYLSSSARMDRAAVSLFAVAPRGWMVLAVCGLTPSFVAGVSAARLAVSLGGVLLSYKALYRLTTGLSSLAGAVIAWRQIAPVFHAAERGRLNEPLSSIADVGPSATPVIDATDLRFTHTGRAEPIVRNCSLAIAPGERIILGGPSGGGKSTLASLLAGLRTPHSGLILLNGLDRHTVGLEQWRRRVVLVPQFHENHVMLGSLAFNALIGDRWPPSEEDLSRADSVLRELGLGPLIDRMPSGLGQTVGETGWQLSHGERSRLYLARALLQRPELLILDESFAQLDPESLLRALDVVLARNIGGAPHRASLIIGAANGRESP